MPIYAWHPYGYSLSDAQMLKKKNALPHFQLAGVCWNPLMQVFATWGDGISLLGALPDETWLKYVGYIPGVMRNNKKVSHNSHWITEPHQLQSGPRVTPFSNSPGLHSCLKIPGVIRPYGLTVCQFFSDFLPFFFTFFYLENSNPFWFKQAWKRFQN